MSFLRSWAVLVCAAVVSVLPAQDQSTPRPVAANGLVVGVVDMGKAFDNYPRTIKERERVKKLVDGWQEEIDRVSKRIEEMKGSLLVLKAGSPDRERKQLELELTMQERQGLAKLLSDRLQVEQMRMHLAIYEDLDAAVAQLAKDRGVHLVLRTDTSDIATADAADKDNAKVMEKRVIAFERRQVWFAADAIDLTSDLIKLLQVWPLESTPKASDAAKAAPPGEASRGGNGGGA